MSYFRYPSGNIPTYANQAALPALASDGAVAVTLDTDSIYVFNLATVTWIVSGGGGGSGTVTSVALSAPSSIFSVSGSPVTTTGTLTFALKTQVANTIFAGPTTGADAAPTFRAMVTADLPSDFGTPGALIGTNITGTAAGLTAGHVSTNANLTGVITSVGNATSIASQTGTGTKFVVDTSPVLITPLLGTPTSGVLTNCTGTAAGLTAGTVTTNANSTGDVTSVGNVTTLGSNFKIMSIGITIDGGGSVPSTGSKGFIYVPYGCTISSVTMLADQSGSAVVDILKSTYSGFPSTSSICASAKPTLSSAQKSQDLGLSGWTLSIAAGDCLEFNLNSCSTITRINLILKVIKT